MRQEYNPEAHIFNTIDIAQLDGLPQEKAFIGKGGSDC